MTSKPAENRETRVDKKAVPKKDKWTLPMLTTPNHWEKANNSGKKKILFAHFERGRAKTINQYPELYAEWQKLDADGIATYFMTEDEKKKYQKERDA